jgi:hypothetical protein
VTQTKPGAGPLAAPFPTLAETLTQTLEKQQLPDWLAAIRPQLVANMPSGPQSLAAAAELAHVAAQCLRLLQHREPIWRLDGEPCFGWRKDLRDENRLFEGAWDCDEDQALEKVSTPVYILTRELEEAANLFESDTSRELARLEAEAAQEVA